MSGDDGDREVSTQTGKETYWKVTMELVNIADGKMGVALWYEVHEGGKNVGRTKLQLKQSLEIPVSNRANVAIDENITQHRFVFDGTYVGQMHDWLDVTTQAMGCPFIDTTNHRFQIKMDGPGSSDCENIAMKGVLSVPYQYYSESVKTQ